MQFSTVFKPENGFLKIALAENFLKFFLGFFRGLLIKARRLSNRLLNSVVWKLQKFSLIKKKLVIATEYNNPLIAKKFKNP